MGWQQIVVSGVVGVAAVVLARWALRGLSGSGGCRCDRGKDASRIGLKQTPLVSLGVDSEPQCDHHAASGHASRIRTRD